MDKVGSNQAVKVLKKGKKKQARDEVDRQKQAEKKKRRLEKALANSAAIISELEKKKQKKKEEQQRLDEEAAAIAEAVALHVLIGEDTDEPCHMMLSKHRMCGLNQWDYPSGFSSSPDSHSNSTYSAGGLSVLSHGCAAEENWGDWGIGQAFPSWGHVRDLQVPYCPETFEGAETCPGLVAAQAVSSLQIREDTPQNKFASQGATAAVINRMLGGSNNRLNLYREL